MKHRILIILIVLASAMPAGTGADLFEQFANIGRRENVSWLKFCKGAATSDRTFLCDYAYSEWSKVWGDPPKKSK